MALKPKAKTRKYRDVEERATICAEVSSGLKDMGLDEDDEGVKDLMAVLTKFVCDEGGAVYSGVIDIPLRRLRVEYRLPGRRVERQLVKLGAMK
jgi:hypothetical protein